MKTTIIPKLTAPGGGSRLKIATIGEQQGNDILHGTVLSEEQGIFQIKEGILDLLPLGVGKLSGAQSTNLAYPVARFYEKPWRVNSLSLLSGQPLPIAREKSIIFDLLGKPEGSLWLDLAASSGMYSRWLAPPIEQQGGDVICLDFSVVMLREAQRYAQSENISNIAFVAARGERLPFGNDSLDGVLCGGSLNEFGEQGVLAVLREVHRTLKPGGKGVFMHLLTATKPLGTLFQNLVARPGGIAFWSLEDTNGLFTRTGFTVVQNKVVGMVAFTSIVKEA